MSPENLSESGGEIVAKMIVWNETRRVHALALYVGKIGGPEFKLSLGVSDRTCLLSKKSDRVHSHVNDHRVEVGL